MKTIILYIIIITELLFAELNAQYETRFGDNCSPKDTFRVLNIFIHIDFDLCPECDPCKNSTPNWPGAKGNSINTGGPVYLREFMDTDFDPRSISGMFTRRFAEASFNQFIVLGDFMVVNIKQSSIAPTGDKFSVYTLRDSAIAVINSLGGLQTIYGHNSIKDYDGTEVSDRHRFMKKKEYYNDSIDFIQFYLRNSTAKFGQVFNGGRADNQAVQIKVPLLINGVPYYNDGGIISGIVGNNDLSNQERQSADVHEMSHRLLGMKNMMHMGGGYPVSDAGNITTLHFNSGGWSIIGSANSSLISCNGYERWRLDWRGPDNQSYLIACRNHESDIQKVDGNQTFFLRDFVTTGDAVRVKLPYVDSGAFNQYIWLENHQVHHNGKIDYPPYWSTECKDDGTAGIYAYYQVGKDSLFRGSINNIDEEMIGKYADHLVPISAEGNWDCKLLEEKQECCISWTKDGRNVQEYVQENPLSGYNDLQTHFFNSSATDKLNFSSDEITFFIKKKQGKIINNLPTLGDNLDPFTDKRQFSMGTNPAPVNVVTYHHFRMTLGTISHSAKLVDNRKIHLSGLGIDFKEKPGGEMQVDIRWDQYDIEKSLRWTGDIVLHEKLNLLPECKITFDQNQTPNRHTRNPVTGLFADPTYFSCLKNSTFTMQPNSEAEMNNLSSFILEPGSMMEIDDNSVFSLNEGCTFVIQTGATLLIRGGGSIEIEDGANMCIELGANIILQDPYSVINLHQGYNSGMNTLVMNGYNCIDRAADYKIHGNGRINEIQRIVYIQNENIDSERYVAGRRVKIGDHVTSSKQEGEVYIQPGSKLIIDASEEVLIDEGVSVLEGADFELR